MTFFGSITFDGTFFASIAFDGTFFASLTFFVEAGLKAGADLEFVIMAVDGSTFGCLLESSCWPS